MLHKKFGYEFSEKGESRVFDAGDSIENTINDNPIVHRRYLKGGKTWRDKGFEPSPADQAAEHAAIFTYNQTACSFELTNPEHAIIETDEDKEDPIIDELKDDLAELYEQVVEVDEESDFVETEEELPAVDEEPAKTTTKKTTRR